MAGHFEKGKWVQEKTPVAPLEMNVVVHVDTTELQQLEVKLSEMRNLFAVPESMTTFWQRLRWLQTGKVKS